MRVLTLIFIFLASFQLAHANEFVAKVIAVLDGDTVLIKRGKSLIKIRMAEIDAPEKAQSYGTESTQSLTEMVLSKQVNVSSEATDRYGRMVAHLYLDGLDVNAEQIRRGMAWEYSYFHSNRSLIKLQKQAMSVPLGLWQQNDPTPPWKWRKKHPSTYSPVTPKKKLAAAPSASHCAAKNHCSQLQTCAQAQHEFKQCGDKTLDGDSDGIPCESLCGDKH